MTIDRHHEQAGRVVSAGRTLRLVAIERLLVARCSAVNCSHLARPLARRQGAGEQ